MEGCHAPKKMGILLDARFLSVMQRGNAYKLVVTD